MARAKGLFAFFVGVGIPVALAVALVAAGVGYAHQHVHDRYANILDDRHAIVTVNDYRHSTASIAATFAGLSVLWLLAAGLCVLVGGSMYANRDGSWE